MTRLLIVSNRLPITATFTAGQVELEMSSGGLATGLKGPHRELGGLWIGYPGDVARLDPGQRERFENALSDQHVVAVDLTRDEVRGFYEEIANGTLWPVFHYLVDQESMHTQRWPTYRAVNQRFADAVVAQYKPGDVIWVHDYHLLLAPAMIRDKLPEARIGFFLHIPFPSSEILSVLPWRKEILEGMLGADLIGFHTPDYVRHFASSVQRLLGLRLNDDHVYHNGRDTMVRAFPMGIDVTAWESRAENAAVIERANEVCHDAAGRKIVLSIDRLDFSKGLIRRLYAIDTLLKSDPDLVENIRFIQVLVPSREGVEAYASLRRRVNELVGRINGTYSTATAVPVHLIYRSIDEAEVSALYRAADVMLVTPVRDGMNLVAKEFVASRVDNEGVLVLSEFAGAAVELQQAILVNPYDVDSIVVAIQRAISMPQRERQLRMEVLREQVRQSDVHAWASDFLSQLGPED